jgi:hypothetical protein
VGLSQPNTLVEALRSALSACASHPDGVQRPVAVLWTDPAAQWRSLAPALRASMPELLELGTYEPAQRRGPAIWLRCVVDRTIAVDGLAEDAVPILYLPGVGRQDLGKGDECPREVQPLVELVHRGVLWLQRGGHDWTATAFLSSKDGLALDLAGDQETTAALLRALPEIAHAPFETLRRRRLDSAYFYELLAPDVVRELLRWMGDPKTAEGRLGASSWAAFVSQMKERFGIDPVADGVLTAGERLGNAEGEWAEAWRRFEEAPGAFPGVVDVLRRSPPRDTLFFDKSRWPDENEKAERALRDQLDDLEGVPHGEACRTVLRLSREHAPRRGWVWTKLGMSPMAQSLEHLELLAELCSRPIGGATVADFAAQYEERGWRADVAAWRALAQCAVQDHELIAEVVATLYEPWLDDSARAFQRAAADVRALAEPSVVHAPPGGCLLFVDGLRYDLGRVLAERLERSGLRVTTGRRWAALPTVTATAKPAVSPAASEVEGRELGAEFSVRRRDNGRPVDAAALRALIEARGYQLLPADDVAAPLGEDARGWCEFGSIDETGHKLGCGLAKLLEDEIARVEQRVAELLRAGWRSVRIVTDHGWLLAPGGLRKVVLPKHLTQSRWSRCAAIAGASQVDVPTFAWRWNSAQVFATAPGAGCFNAEVEYAHGGVSLQECLTPDILVEAGDPSTASAAIAGVRWQGMRCFVQVRDAESGAKLDLRLGRANGRSVAQTVKPIERETSLLLVDDSAESQELLVVVLDASGGVVAQRKTRVGETT